MGKTQPSVAGSARHTPADWNRYEFIILEFWKGPRGSNNPRLRSTSPTALCIGILRAIRMHSDHCVPDGQAIAMLLGADARGKGIYKAGHKPHDLNSLVFN